MTSRNLRLSAALLPLTMALAACTAPLTGHPPPAPEVTVTVDANGNPQGTSSAQNPAQSSAGGTSASSQGLEQFTHQKVEWTSCEGEKFDCADFTVPADYSDPDGDTVALKAIRLKSSNPKAKNIFVNPGGPGGSGYDLVKNQSEELATGKLGEEYSFIGFDPRGVKRSDGIECLSDAERDELAGEVADSSTPKGLKKAQENAKKVAEACLANSGPVLQHMSTVNVAKDLDVMRQAVGDEKLSYMGFSYGTVIGAVYAQLFPEKVGKMLLDGALSPNMPTHEVDVAQAKGFEDALDRYLAYCTGKDGCPFPSAEEGRTKIQGWIEKYNKTPGTTDDGRPITGMDIANAVITPLYSTQMWPILTQILKGLDGGDPKMAKKLADLAADREENGAYSSNSTFAFTAVNCADRQDGQISDEQMKKNAEELKDAAPLFGPLIAYSEVSCNAWKVKDPDPFPKIEAPAIAPVLVVITTHDPATTPTMGDALVKDLGSAAHKLSYSGDGHTAYGGSGSPCVQKAVQAYFLTGSLPGNGAVCGAEKVE